MTALLLAALVLAVCARSAGAVVIGAGIVAAAVGDLATGARQCACGRHRAHTRAACARCAVTYMRAVAA